MYQLGVDTGGTFTDFVTVDKASGATIMFKLPSSPRDPACVVAAGFERLAREHGIAADKIDRFVFGTTVATNALLERDGARVALLTTDGTRDVLEIQRMWRQRLFDLYLRKPEPFVARRDRFEVGERVAADGTVLRSLEPEEANRLADLVAPEYEAIAISLLFSFVAPEHEARLRDAILRRAPDAFVSLSSDISPEFREYERTSTTVINAYVMPKIDRLVSRLETLVRDAGYAGPIGIMQSNGGLMSIQTAQQKPVNTLLSGPAGGVVGAMEMARAAGLDNVIAVDMGGTSLDVSVIAGGKMELAAESHMAGFPVRVPQINVHTIGAGGGSIARIVHGALQVGPESAGADPGPACYGRGGKAPTSTDAAAVLGYIDPHNFAGGTIRIDADAARRVIGEQLADALEGDVEDCAYAIVQVQVANMVNGIRSVSVEKGLDPREFVLLSFGGAGGLYAGLIAEELGIGRVLVPVNAGVLSAHGMLMTDIRHTKPTTRLMPAEPGSLGEVLQIYASLEEELMQTMRDEKVPPERVSTVRDCQARYRGQAYEVTVPVGEDISLEDVVTGFHAAHEALYGHAAPDEPVDLVTFRVTAIGEVEKRRIETSHEPCRNVRPPDPASQRHAYFGAKRGWLGCPVFERGSLATGSEIAGPALVADTASTSVVYPGHTLVVDAVGNLVISAAKSQ